MNNTIAATLFAFLVGTQPGAFIRAVPKESVTKSEPVEKVEVGSTEPAQPPLGSIVLVTHRVSVLSHDIDENENLPAQSRSVGWLVQAEPETVISMTRWDGVEPPNWWTVKRFPSQLVISVDLVSDPG